jgi:hypothetical protein
VIPSQVRMTLDITRIPWPPIGSGPFAETSALYQYVPLDGPSTVRENICSLPILT